MQTVYVSLYMFNNEIKVHVNDTLDNAKASWITSYSKVGTPTFSEIGNGCWSVQLNGHLGTITRATAYNYGEHI